MLIVHDAGNDLRDPHVLGPNDVIGIYRYTIDNIVYGAFSRFSGASIYPGQKYDIVFSPPALPLPDTHEPDDEPFTAPLIDYTALPVRQYHTFHENGNGEADEDWFKIFLKAGQAVTVETFYADGQWTCDTRIDLADSQVNYITSARDKSFEDSYAKMSYRNDTGLDQSFHFLVRADDKTNKFADSKIGEYVVEFRQSVDFSDR